ncbi:Hypothetical_protein [Hexamita inflata]|uniref:Hypothetical_protein n=1 Tax=Hexamita inflata TaxID=28002 RepID=A0ABP1HVS0_9EUKA
MLTCCLYKHFLFQGGNNLNSNSVRPNLAIWRYVKPCSTCNACSQFDKGQMITPIDQFTSSLFRLYFITTHSMTRNPNSPGLSLSQFIKRLFSQSDRNLVPYKYLQLTVPYVLPQNDLIPCQLCFLKLCQPFDNQTHQIESVLRLDFTSSEFIHVIRQLSLQATNLLLSIVFNWMKSLLNEVGVCV